MQTVHTYYTMQLGKKEYPKHHAHPKINPEIFNTFAVEVLPDLLRFSINGIETFRYPKIETNSVGQFPFGQELYLMIDMQVGASWLPEPDQLTYPAYMDIDWGKIYEVRIHNDDTRKNSQ